MKTKRLILAAMALVLFSFTTVKAQKNIVRISPLGFAKFKAKVHYERTLSDRFSAGLIGNYMFGVYNGVRIEPYARFYVQGTAPAGLYVQGKYHFSHMTLSKGTVLAGWAMPSGYNFSEMGGSLGVGYQVLFGKDKNFAFDIYSGYRFSSLGYTRDIVSSSFDDAAKDGYRLLHVNSFDLGISLGYKF